MPSGWVRLGAVRLRRRPLQQSADSYEMARKYDVPLQQHRAVRRVVGYF